MTDLVRILDRGYELIWRENRPEDSLRALPPDFEWVVPGHPEGAVRHGSEGVLEFFREWIEPWDDLARRMVVYFDVDEARRDAGL